MRSKYVLLKCVPSEMSEQASPILRLADLQQVVARYPQFRWGTDPKGVITVTNSYGSVTDLQPQQGFSFAVEPQFFIATSSKEGLRSTPSRIRESSMPLLRLHKNSMRSFS